MKMKGALLRSALIAALGGLLFGFDTAVISGAEGILKELFAERYLAFSGFFGTGSFWHGFTVASALIGTIVGALIFGKPADKHGRRKILFVLGALYFISATGSALAWSWSSFVLLRFIGGLAVGGSSVVAPMYNAEISPARFRGRMVALTQFNIVFGVLLAFSSNYVINSLELGEVTWRWMFGVEVFPALAFFLLLFLKSLTKAVSRVDSGKKLVDWAFHRTRQRGEVPPAVERPFLAHQAGRRAREGGLVLRGAVRRGRSSALAGRPRAIERGS